VCPGGLFAVAIACRFHARRDWNGYIQHPESEVRFRWLIAVLIWMLGHLAILGPAETASVRFKRIRYQGQPAGVDIGAIP
jgi:hypothetical protein